MPAKTLPGFKRERGGTRGYIAPNGQRLSRRQYDKLAHAVAGKASISPQRQAIQTRAQRNYNRLLSQRARELRQEGKTVNKAEIRKTEDFKQLIRDLKAKDKPGEHSQRVNDRRRSALEKIGARQGIPEWVPVGLSDRYRKGKLRRDRIPKGYRFTS
jgi:uncharacterized protein YukE